MKPKLPAGNPATLKKSLNPNATSAYRAPNKGAANIRGLPAFMHGKLAGRSMVLARKA